MIGLGISMQEEVFLSILMASVICVHFSEFVDHLCSIGMHFITLLDMLMPRY